MSNKGLMSYYRNKQKRNERSISRILSGGSQKEKWNISASAAQEPTDAPSPFAATIPKDYKIGLNSPTSAVLEIEGPATKRRKTSDGMLFCNTKNLVHNIQ